MSTRCHIIIEDKDTDCQTILYSHSDGYPEEIVPLVAEFLALFHKRRGFFDPIYLPAQLLVFLVNKRSEYMLDYAKKERDKEANNPGMHQSMYIKRLIDFDGNNFLGFGISNGLHGDVNYAYVITDGEVNVYETGYHSDFRESWSKVTTKPQAKMIYQGRVPKKWKAAKAA